MSDENTVNENTESVVSDDWKSQVSEEYRDDPSLSNINDIESLVKSYVSSQRMLGNSVRIPSEEASSEAYEDFYNKLSEVPGVAVIPDTDDTESLGDLYNKLGRPENPDGYDVAIPKELVYNPDEVNDFRKLAYDLGLSKGQAKQLVDYEVQRYQNAMEYQLVQKEHGEQELKKMWGNDYNSRMEGVRSVLHTYRQTNPDRIDELIASPAANNPIFIDMLSKLAMAMQEEGTIQAGGGKLRYGLTPEEAQAQIDDILENKSHPYWNSEDPGHDAAVQKVSRLYEAVNPSNG